MIVFLNRPTLCVSPARPCHNVTNKLAFAEREFRHLMYPPADVCTQ